MAIKVPPSLKLSQLKQIACKCGISSSGTKPVLAERLADEIKRRKDYGQRVLSIDMGIRNLAFCFLDFTDSRSGGSKLSSARLPSLQEWRRMAFMAAPLQSPPAVKEVFGPSTMSIAACKLVKEHLLAYKPSSVLIERQRFRSMGSAHILEWTVRVNMLESMLYAIFETLKIEGQWQGEVVGIAPGKVGPFWVGEDIVKNPTRGQAVEYKKETKSQIAKIRNKGLKMDLVRKWLQEKSMFSLGSTGVERTAAGYVEKWDRVPGRSKVKKGLREDQQNPVEEMGKLDDLADCLLQGLAWRAWEDNKDLVRNQGVEILLDAAVETPRGSKNKKGRKPEVFLSL